MIIYDYCTDCGAPMVPTKLGDIPAGAAIDGQVYVQCNDPSCGARAGHRPVSDFVIIKTKKVVKK